MENAAKLLANKYKKIFFLQDDDIINVQKAGALILKEIDAAFSEFYAWIGSQIDLKRIFTDRVLDEIEKREKDTWADLVQANVDDNYINRQQEAGQLYQQMGIPFEAYVASLVAFHEIIENIYIRRNIGSFQLLRSFKKVAGINICIAIDTYNEAINHTLREQHTALMQMSTPVTKLWKKLLFLPLVGIIDSRRAQDIMAAMLNKIAESQASVFILDISGIAVMDTAVANYLIKITKAASLMGCRCIVSGISGTVAQTIVELGIQTDEIQTTSNMQDALKQAFAIVKKSKRKKNN